MTPLRTGLTTFLAAPPTPPPGKGAEWGKAAPIGLLILVLLGVALYLLIKSMNRHMRKVSGLTSFDATDGPDAGPGTTTGVVAADPDGSERSGAATVVATAVETPPSRTDPAPGAPDPKS